MHTSTHFDNAIIYFLITDRFLSSGDSHVGSYGRLCDPKGIGTFHGGNFAGVTSKLREGWFSALGVNTIWVSAPYEQIHGCAPRNGNFIHEPYHGYWPLDFTCVDKNFGDEISFREMVDTAHQIGIKIIIDVVMSHVGYAEPLAFEDCPSDTDHVCGATVRDGKRYPDPTRPCSPHWWGPNWVRTEFPGFPSGGDDDLTRINFGLPKLLIERDDEVELPSFLAAKRDTRAINLPGKTVRGYLISWLTHWVRKYGIDGFRCDSVRHVPVNCWSELKQVATDALNEWRAGNNKIDDNSFWMLGEVYGHGLYRSEYYDHGFDSIINFGFQHELHAILDGLNLNRSYDRSLVWRRLDKLYRRYSDELSSRRYDVLSYLSSHDTFLFDRRLLGFGASALMLLPGGIQIFYGDESARPPSRPVSNDPTQATRSDMNWASLNHGLLYHWKRLGQFRRRHVAIARGSHIRLCTEPYVFSRVDAITGDRVLIALGSGNAVVSVAGLFDDGQKLFDAYNDEILEVVEGHVNLAVVEISLLEKWGSSYENFR